MVSGISAVISGCRQYTSTHDSHNSAVTDVTVTCHMIHMTINDDDNLIVNGFLCTHRSCDCDVVVSYFRVKLFFPAA